MSCHMVCLDVRLRVTLKAFAIVLFLFFFYLHFAVIFLRGPAEARFLCFLYCF